MASLDARVTVAVDSPETVDAAAGAGIGHVVVDVNIGLPRCGCAPDDAARIADLARARGIEVRGVMGYEGHLMMVLDRYEQRAKVDAAIDVLLRAHQAVGGEIVSAGGTGTHHLLERVTEVQAGSYVLMDSQYAAHGHPFEQACWVVGTVIATSMRHAVADVGLKAMGMDHGNPSIDGASVWFLSDEHITFAPDDTSHIGDRVWVTPAHIDPTMAMHEVAWVVRGDEVIDRWLIDLRGW
jgi:D-serine deaminase-like pyridoxal phosphate-dependent protein